MLQPSKDPLTLAEVSRHWMREPRQTYSEDEIFSELVSAFWRGDFANEQLGWDEQTALLKLYGSADAEPLGQVTYSDTLDDKMESEHLVRDKIFEILCLVSREALLQLDRADDIEQAISFVATLGIDTWAATTSPSLPAPCNAGDMIKPKLDGSGSAR